MDRDLGRDVVEIGATDYSEMDRDLERDMGNEVDYMELGSCGELNLDCL